MSPSKKAAVQTYATQRGNSSSASKLNNFSKLHMTHQYNIQATTSSSPDKRSAGNNSALRNSVALKSKKKHPDSSFVLD